MFNTDLGGDDLRGRMLTWCDDPDEPFDAPQKTCDAYVIRDATAEGDTLMWLCQDHAS